MIKEKLTKITVKGDSGQALHEVSSVKAGTLWHWDFQVWQIYPDEYPGLP